MKPISIHFKSEETRLKYLTELLATNGFWEWHKDTGDNQDISPKEIDNLYPWDQWPVTSFHFDTGYVCGIKDSASGLDEEHVDLLWPKILNFEAPPAPIKVKLNASYTALVSNEKVVVGCQTFPVKVINNSVAALAECNKSNGKKRIIPPKHLKKKKKK